MLGNERIRTPDVQLDITIFRLFTVILGFLLRRCLVFVSSVRSFKVVEFNITINSCSEFFFGAVFFSIKLFSLQIRKEALHHRIVIGNIRSWKGLSHIQRLQIHHKPLWTVICAVICVKNQPVVGSASFISVFKCAFCELGTICFVSLFCLLFILITPFP